MKAHINQHVISTQGIYRHHLQLTEVECVQFLPHQIGITPLYAIMLLLLLRTLSTDTIAQTFLIDMESQKISITLKPNIY